MRPRHKAAENDMDTGLILPDGDVCFNEAAA